MNPKALIDLHCDTLTDCRPTPAGNPDTLDDPERVLSLSAMPEALAERAFSERPLPFPCICLDEPCFIPRAENGFWYLDGTEHSLSGNLYLFNTDTGELYNYTW